MSEQFNEVFEDKFLIWTYHDIKEIYLEEHHLYKVIKKYVDVGDKVKLSCKPGKIVIERREEKENCQCTECRLGVLHKSDCAIHNEPAQSKGKCNCGAEEERKRVLLKNHVREWTRY